MKKIHLLSLTFLLFLGACNTTKVAKQAEKDMRGDWVLNSVNSNNSNVMVNSIFNHASTDCFEGSEWHLVANNNKGYYTLEGANCPLNQNQINWHMEEENGVPYLWFKQLGTDKAKNVKAGYKLRVVSITENNAILSQQIPFEDNIITLNYNFIKK